MRARRAACSCCRGDEAFLAHARQHDVAARERIVEMVPRRQRGGARAARRSSATPASVSCFAGLPNRCRDIVSTP